MTEKQTIAQEIANYTQLDSLSFEKSIQKYLRSEGIILILADLLASDFHDSQKILAASAINRIIIHKLDDDYPKWHSYWQQFYRDVLMHPQVDRIEWRHLELLTRGMSYLFEDMAEHLCKTICPIFEGVNIKVKILIYQSFSRTQTTTETRYVFLKETIESYIVQILNFVFWIHQKQIKAKDSLKLQKSILNNFALVLNNLEKYLNNSNINELLVKLSLNDQLFQLIIEQLLYDADKSDYQSIRKKEFSRDRMREIAIISQTKDSQMEQHLNEVKAFTITIFSILLRQYDKKVGIQEFDRYKHLNFMENFTPLVLLALIDLISKKKITQDYQLIIVSLLQYLTLTVKFNFLLQFYDTNLQKLLFKVCFPLLRADEIQIQQFEQNSDGFIQTAEEAIEMPQEQDYAKTVKNAASQFLQKLVTILDGSLIFVMESNISIIKYVLTGNIEEGLLQIIKNFQYEMSIETSLTILALFSDIYLNRKDLLRLLKNKLLDLDCITTLNKLDLARLFIFLAYTFESIYQECQEEGAKFLVLAACQLQSQTAISKCSLMLFENCLKLGFGQQIWDNLLLKLENTKIITIFKIFKRIVQQKLQDLPFDYTKTLIARLIQRLIVEYQNAEQKNGIKKATPIVTQIFNIMEEITQNKKYIKNEPGIVDAIWPIFDLFQLVETIEFEDDLLKVFNNVLIAAPNVDQKFFNFLNPLPHFHLKYQGFNSLLLNTFTNLIQKGRQHFINNKNPISLQNLVECLKHCYSIYKKQESMVHFCIFMQQIYLKYSTHLKKDEDFFVILQRFYNQNKNIWENETKAAVINLLIIAQGQYGGMDLNIIKQNPIEIFQGYQAKIFALGLKLLITSQSLKTKQNKKQNQHLNQISFNRIIDYLCYSMRLLHFLREVNSARNPPKKSYYTPRFQESVKIDPFMQICESLDNLKRNLQPNRYDSIIQTLRGQISLGQIKDLLSRRLMDNNMRKVYKVRVD